MIGTTLSRYHILEQWFDRAVVDRSHWLVFLDVDPRFDAVRKDPRFDALRAKVGLKA